MRASRNWSGTARWDPTRRTPAGPAFGRGEVAPGRLRGSGHAFNALGATTGVEYLARTPHDAVQIHERDGASVARLPAGSSIGEVARALAFQDRRLAAPPTSQYPTIGGFVATGGHGSAAAVGTLAGSATLVELELVDPAGRLHRLDRERPEELDAARVSLGALGWVRSVTVRVREGATVVQRSRPGDLDDALRPEFRLGHEQAEAWWLPATERVQLVSVDPVTTGDGGVTDPDAGRRRAGLRRLLGEDAPLVALDAALRVRPAAAPRLMGLAARFAIGDVARQGPWDVLCVGPRRLRGVSMEMAVPVDRSEEAIRAVAGVVDRHRRQRRYALAFPVNLRWAAADGNRSLAPNADADVLFIDVTVPRRRAASELLVDVEDALIPLGGLPHWGKAFVRSPVTRVPHWERWKAVRRRFDPDDRLVNPFLARLLDA